MIFLEASYIETIHSTHSYFNSDLFFSHWLIANLFFPALLGSNEIWEEKCLSISMLGCSPAFVVVSGYNWFRIDKISLIELYTSLTKL